MNFQVGDKVTILGNKHYRTNHGHYGGTVGYVTEIQGEVVHVTAWDKHWGEVCVFRYEQEHIKHTKNDLFRRQV